MLGPLVLLLLVFQVLVLTLFEANMLFLYTLELHFEEKEEERRRSVLLPNFTQTMSRLRRLFGISCKSRGPTTTAW